MTADIRSILDAVLTQAKKEGATAAEAIMSRSASSSVALRLGKLESLTRSEETEIGLRVFVGARSAIVSSSDQAPDTLQEIVARAIAMARAAPEDPYAGIADTAQLTRNIPDLDLYDPTEMSVETMTEMADRTEQAALDVQGVTNSDGAECSTGGDAMWYASSNGFSGGYQSSGFSISASVIAGSGSGMETDYDYDSACFLSDLRAPEDIGRAAGARAVRALQPRKGSTKQVPVVFDQRLAGGLIGTLSSAVSGSAVARGTTFLKDMMGQQVFASGITITDDPYMKRGARSRPFDGEGLQPQKRNIIEDGVLTGWVLDLASARQMGLQSTGNAVRGASSPPMPRVANFMMQPGQKTPAQLIADIKEGFFVTQLMGSGGNIVTGDYSRGASGFWIENGQIAYPISEMTIAGNLKDMWMRITPANDLVLRTGIDAPTLCIEGLTVAGA